MKLDLNGAELAAVQEDYGDTPIDVLAAAALMLGEEPLVACYSERVDGPGENGEIMSPIWYGVTSTRLIIVRGTPRSFWQEHDGFLVPPSASAIRLSSIHAVEVDEFPISIVEIPWQLNIDIPAVRLIGSDSTTLPEARVSTNSRDLWETFSRALIGAIR